jgi:hypothetical protein
MHRFAVVGIRFFATFSFLRLPESKIRCINQVAVALFKRP